MTGQKRYQAWMFGPFRVHRDGEQLGQGAPRRSSSRLLLKLLLLSPDQTWSHEQLTSLMWPDHDSAVVRSRLHGATHELRRYLEPELDRREISSQVRTESGVYRFVGKHQWSVDLWDVQTAMRKAQTALTTGLHEDAANLLHPVIEAHGSMFLPEDLYEDAFADARAHMDIARAAAERWLLSAWTSMGEHHRVLQHGLEFLGRDPLSSDIALAVASSLFHAQGPGAAARFLAAFGDRTRTETGVVDVRVQRLLVRLERPRRDSA